MNRWFMIRRMRGPAFLILVGINALLSAWGILSFGRSWPLYLILAGVLRLAERAALADAPPPPYPYAAPGWPSGPNPTYPSPSSLVPSPGPASPGPASPGAGNPGAGSPGAGSPGAGNPGAGDPGVTSSEGGPNAPASASNWRS